MYLTNKAKFEILKGVGVNGTPAQVKFDNISFTVYLDRFELESLLIGRVLQESGVGDLVLNQLETFIEDYGAHEKEDGYFNGLSGCCGME